MQSNRQNRCKIFRLIEVFTPYQNKVRNVLYYYNCRTEVKKKLFLSKSSGRSSIDIIVIPYGNKTCTDGRIRGGYQNDSNR